jgi:hypothetical protein
MQTMGILALSENDMGDSQKPRICAICPSIGLEDGLIVH